MPAGAWPGAIILKISDPVGALGWAAIRVTDFTDDSRFGDLRLGSIIDALAAPGEEKRVIRAATTALQRAGVDLIATNFTHPAWRRALISVPLVASLEEKLLRLTRDTL